MSQHARLSYLVRQAQLATYQRLDRALRGFGLTPAQYTVLAILSRRGESLSSAALSRRLGVSPQSANEIVASLNALGLVRRTEGAENRSSDCWMRGQVDTSSGEAVINSKGSAAMNE